MNELSLWLVVCVATDDGLHQVTQLSSSEVDPDVLSCHCTVQYSISAAPPCPIGLFNVTQQRIPTLSKKTLEPDFEPHYSTSFSTMENRACRYFVAGSCFNEDTSRFQHPHRFFTLLSLESKVATINYSHSGGPGAKVEVPCKVYLQGTCTKGDFCNFEHSNPIISTATATAIAIYPVSKGARSSTPCRCFQASTCTKGELCSFSHEVQAELVIPKTLSYHRPITDVGLAAPTWARSNSRLGEHDERKPPRNVGGSNVFFADEASVLTVSLISDFSAVSTSDLPQDTSIRIVVDLLSNRRFYWVSPDCILFKKFPDGLKKTAVIKVRDHYFVNKLLQCLKNTPIMLRNVKAQISTLHLRGHTDASIKWL